MERYDLNAVPNASSETAGVLRVANEVDEKNCGCKDAAITPSNLYSLLDCRKANTTYTAGAVVACPYHTEFLLKCVTAGSTATGSLDTANVTKGQVITDGGAKWEVIAKAIIDASISGKNITFTFADGTTKVVTTQDTEKPADMTDYIVESYRNRTEWYEVYKSGKVRQGGFVPANSQLRDNVSVAFLKPFATTNISIFTTTTYTGNDDGLFGGGGFRTGSLTTTGFRVGVVETGRNDGVWWIAEGQGA